MTFQIPEKIQFYRHPLESSILSLRIHDCVQHFRINKDSYPKFHHIKYNLKKILKKDCLMYGFEVKYPLILEVPLEFFHNKGLKIMSWDTEYKIKEKIYYSVMENLSEFFPEEFL